MTTPFDALLQERGLTDPASPPTPGASDADIFAQMASEAQAGADTQPGLARRVARDVGQGLMEAPFQAARGVAEGLDASAGWAYNGSLAAYYPEARTVTGSLINDVAQFATGWVAAGRAMRIAGLGRAATTTGQIGMGMARGAAADAGFFDGQEERLSNLVEAYPELSNPVTEFLSARPDDSEALGRFKNAVEGLVVGGALEGLIVALRGMRAARSGNLDEAGRVVDEPGAPRVDDPFSPEAAARREREEATSTGTEADIEVTVTAPREGDDPNVQSTAPPENRSTTARMGDMRERFAEAEDRAARATGDTEDVPAAGRPAQASRVNDLIELTPEQHRDITRQNLLEAGFGQGRNFSGIRTDLIQGDVELAQVFNAHEVVVREQLQALRGPERISLDETRALARRMAEELGGNPELIVQRMIAEVNDVQHAHARLLTYRNMIASTADKYWRYAKALSDPRGNNLAGFKDRAALAEAYENVSNLLVNMQGLYKGIQSSYARGLNAMRTRANSDGDLRRWLHSVEIDAVRAAMTEGNVRGAMTASRGSMLRRLTGTVNEYWINSILSGPKTHAINAMSNTLTTAFQPLERMVAGALRYDRTEFTEGALQYAGLVASVKDAIQSAGRALRRGDGILDPGRNPVESRSYITADRFNVSNQTLANVVNGLGATIRLPTRLLTTQDEFFKQLTYRSRVRAEAYREAMSAGLTPGSREFGGRVQKALDDAFDPASGIATRQEDLAAARNNTFTDDLSASTWSGNRTFGETLMDATQNHPLLQLIVPFVRTPTNIARWFWNRTPGLNLARKQYMDDISGVNGADAQGRAQAQMATGGALWMTAIAAAFEGNITGGGPTDPQIRRMMERTGWRPYSVKVTQEDGSTEFRAFDRLDPIGMFFATAGDYAEVSGHLAEREADQVALDMTVSLARQLQNKTYLSGLVRALGALAEPERRGERFIYGLTGSFMPSLLNQAFRNDPVQREVRSVLDSLRARAPGSDGIDPVRNILGEPVATPPGWGPDWLSPISQGTWRNVGPTPNTQEWRYTPSSDVHNEIARQMALHNSAIRPPAPKIGQVNLREFQTGQGEQTAYDRYQQLVGEVKVSGMTVTERLRGLINSETYLNRATDGSFDHNGSRIDLIRTVIGTYRQVAERQLRREMPELDQALRADERLQAIIRVQRTAPTQ